MALTVNELGTVGSVQHTLEGLADDVISILRQLEGMDDSGDDVDLDTLARELGQLGDSLKWESGTLYEIAEAVQDRADAEEEEEEEEEA